MSNMMMIRLLSVVVLIFGVTGVMIVGTGSETVEEDGAIPFMWANDFPKMDFTKHSIDLGEIRSGGPRRDIIPAIDEPIFVSAVEDKALKPTDPVIGVIIGGEAKAYPLYILMWHEIANDTVGGVPVTVTFCPLCNSGIVFDRRIDGQVLDFGVSGLLRNSDMIMYDRQTESWWQQFLGEGIVGDLTGKRLKIVPARLESFANFKKRAPNGLVMVPKDLDLRDYGENPYEGYDGFDTPPIFEGKLPENIAPMARVVVVDGEAWSLDLLRTKQRLTSGDLEITWEAGQVSALDQTMISEGRDVGNVVVRRKTADGALEDVAYDVSFAFAYRAFHPEGVLHLK